MAVCDHLPYQLISDELYCLINSDSININYLSLAVLDSMKFNLLNFQHDTYMIHDTDPLSYNPINSTYISSQYVYLNDNKKTTI